MTGWSPKLSCRDVPCSIWGRMKPVHIWRGNERLIKENYIKPLKLVAYTVGVGNCIYITLAVFEKTVFGVQGR